MLERCSHRNNPSRSLNLRVKLERCTLINPYIFAILAALLSVYMFTDIGFHRWHGSHLTPHMLGVSLNLSETGLLCNSLSEGCESYHRHPPLYFYVNLFLAKLSSNTQAYVSIAMATSIIFNYMGIMVLMRTYGHNRTEKYIILLLSSSSLLFVVNLTLSTYDSLIVLLFSMIALSEKEKSNIISYLTVFLMMILSWYFILAASIYSCYRIYYKNYKILIPYITGLCLTGFFLVSGSDYFYENFEAAVKNVDFSKNVNQERMYSNTETLKMIGVNIFYLISPITLLIGIFLLLNLTDCIKIIRKQPAYVYFPLIVFLVWNSVFFRWSLVHNFIYLILTPFYIPLTIQFMKLMSRTSILFIACLALIVTMQLHVNVMQDYDDLPAFENVGVEIFKEATKTYGFSNY